MQRSEELIKAIEEAKKELRRENNRRYKARNKESIKEKEYPKNRERAKKWYAENREYAIRKAREYARNNPEVSKKGSLKRNFGITLAEYDQMMEDQGGVCAICKTLTTKRGLAVDHNHETKKVRGLLCGRCNCGVGQFLDNPDLLRAAVSYLESHNENS